MWLFTYNHTYFGYIQITTLNNKNTFGAPYRLMSLKNPLKDVWNLATRQMGINSFKIYDVTTRFRAVLPCGLRRVSHEVFDEQ